MQRIRLSSMYRTCVFAQTASSAATKLGFRLAVRHEFYRSQKLLLAWNRASTTRIDHRRLVHSSVPDNNFSHLLPVLQHTVKRLEWSEVTEIQKLTWPAAIEGRSILGRARTGTGKTAAFLLPSIQRALEEQKLHGQPTDSKVRVLIIAPTRELARQIHTHAQTFLSPSHQVSQEFLGGTPKKRDIFQLERRIPMVLTATPGRLLDHIEKASVKDVPFRELLQSVQTVVLDEMDVLLNMGFRDHIQKILEVLPKDKQVMLFSATVPPAVHSFLPICFPSSDYDFIDCVKEDPAVESTAESREVDSDLIEQSHVVIPTKKVVSGVVHLVLELMKQENHKILVFFPMTSQVAFFAHLFNNGIGRQVYQIHSKKSQNYRSFTSDRFRHARSAVMLTSDVSARGVDYPDVTHVVQVGIPKDRFCYVHRLGRTGRAGKAGKGILVLTESETGCVNDVLSNLSIPVDDNLQKKLDEGLPLHLQADMSRIKQEIQRGMQTDLEQEAQAVYRASFAYYKLRFSSTNSDLVEFVNCFAQDAGLSELPALSPKLASQYGLDKHESLNIRGEWSSTRNFDVGRKRKTRW